MFLQSSEVAPEKAKKAAKKPRKKAVHSKSFVQNIYRGVIEPEQMFPYPEVNFEFFLRFFRNLSYYVGRQVVEKVKLNVSLNVPQLGQYCN